MASRDTTLREAAYWYVPLSRAIPAAALAVVITFTGNHSAELGFFTFGGFAILTGALVAILSWRTLGRSVERNVFATIGAITLASGLVALIWPGAGIGFFVFLLAFWAAFTGFLELYAGFRSRGRHPASKDWMFVGGVTVLLAAAVLIVPPDLRQEFSGDNGVQGILSSSIVVVGALGAYGAIIAVYLVIAGLSLKWAPTPTPAPQDGTPS